MRFLMLTALAAFLVCGCATESETGNLPPRPGDWEYHRGHHRSYWNHAGEAYGEAGEIRNLVVLPVALPVTFKGRFSSPDEANWRKEWPKKGAEILARCIAGSADIRVAATTGENKPVDGYYLLFEITDFDVGEFPEAAGSRTETTNWSYLTAVGRIYNAKTGKEVAELLFQESTGRYDAVPPFESLMSNAAADLCEWFRERQAKPGTGAGAGSGE